MNKCIKNLHIISNTWIKDSNDLFDYESSEILRQEFNINTPCSFHRNKNQIEIQDKELNETLNPVQQGESLFNIDKIKNDYFFKSNSLISPNNIKIKETPEKENIWISLNFYNNQKLYNGYFINQGDLIKIGKVMFKIKEIKLEKENNKYVKNNFLNCNKKTTLLNNNNLNLENINKLQNNKKKFCRICYGDEKDSPLINPCKCSGGLKYVHLFCLRYWIKSKSNLISSNDDCLIYNLNQISCELCKENFPDYIKIDNQYFSIFDFEENNFKNFISLDSYPINDKKSIFIISFDNKSIINVGRSHDNELRIFDASISRNHCKISLINKKEFILEDLDSKFGTLVFLNTNKLKIYPFNILPIQIGRTLLHFNIQIYWSLFHCFKIVIKPDKKEKCDYSKINAKYILFDEALNVKTQDNVSSEDSFKFPKGKSLPKEILMKDDDRRNLEILLNVTGSKGIDDVNCINTLNLVSSDKILKKKDE